MSDQPDDERLELSDSALGAMHLKLGEWVSDCERDANEQFATGRGGQIGQIIFRAFYGDEGISVAIERTIVTEVE